MAHVSRWLSARGLSEKDLTPECVEAFLASRRAAGYMLWCSPKGVAPLLAYLRGLGVAPVPEVATASTQTEIVLERYVTYLLEERSLAPGTVRDYIEVARLFLEGRPPVRGLALWELTASEVIEFVTAECQHRSVGSVKYVVTALPALLRYCYLEGVTSRPLAEAVPLPLSVRCSVSHTHLT